MMIHKDKCIELGLPKPKSFHTQKTYLIESVAAGYTYDTRISRYIGIHNLHSIASAILKKAPDLLTLKHGRVLCPFTGKRPSQHVDIIYMTPRQQQAYKQRNKKAAKD